MENKTQHDKFEIKIGDIVFNQYKVLKQLGKGGMDSVIYLVEDITEKTPSNSFNNKKYALKIIDRVENTTDEAWHRYYDECVTCTRISQCENVAKTYHVAELVKNKTIMILMEYIDGNSLREVIQKQGSLGVQESLFLFRKILIALQDLHSFNNKIIHRDLKPENILLSRDRSNLKIIDFGISSVVFTSFDKNAKKEIKHFSTNENQLYGTYPYISPSLYLAYSPKATTEKRFEVINEQCDFFSIGIILYEMLTGNKPFNGDLNDQKVILLPLRYDLPPLSKNNPKISPAIENVIFRCIASKPDDLKYRYTNVKEIIKDVDDIINNPQEGKLTELIKPYNKRTIQANVFDIESEKSKLKFYNSSWFYWLIIWITVAIIAGIVILLVIINTK